TRIGQFFAGRCDDTSPMPAGFSEITAQLLVKPPISVLDAVFNRVQLALGEKLVTPANDDIRAFPCVQIVAELRRINLLVRLGIESVPAQDVIARAPDQNVCQQVRQLSIPVLDQPEVL